MTPIDPEEARKTLAELIAQERALPIRKRAAVYEARAAGVPPVEMAYTFGVSVTTIYNWLSQAEKDAAAD